MLILILKLVCTPFTHYSTGLIITAETIECSVLCSCFTGIISFNPHKDPMRSLKNYSHFFQRWHLWLKEVKSLPGVTELPGGRARIGSQSACPHGPELAAMTRPPLCPALTLAPALAQTSARSWSLHLKPSPSLWPSSDWPHSCPTCLKALHLPFTRCSPPSGPGGPQGPWCLGTVVGRGLQCLSAGL